MSADARRPLHPDRRTQHRGISGGDQLTAINELHRRLGAEGIEYWLFGGWAVDFHLGAVTRPHDDLDLAIWIHDVERVAALLSADGWISEQDDAPPGTTAFTRAAVRVELAFLQRDDAARAPYTPIGGGRRAAWATGAFGDDLRTLAGVQAHVIALSALREEKTGPRDDPNAVEKDRQDLKALEGLG